MEDKDNIETSKISEFNDDSLRKIAKEIVTERLHSECTGSLISALTFYWS